MSLWVCECFCRRACIYLYLWIWVEAIIKVLTLKKSLACDISSVLIRSVLLHLAETAKWCKKKKKILCNPLTLQINFTSRCLCIWFYASFSSFKCLFYFRVFTNQIFCVPHTHTHTQNKLLGQQLKILICCQLSVFRTWTLSIAFGLTASPLWHKRLNEESNSPLSSGLKWGAVS